MAIFRRNTNNSNLFFSSSPPLLSLLRIQLFQYQRWTHHDSNDESGGDQIHNESLFSPLKEGLVDTSMWRKFDSRKFGLRRTSISPSTWTVLRVLQSKGFEAYLVGGCVRDLILGKTPKDFDVVTTASLKEIKKYFYRCLIVGSRFPICHVYVYGNIIEVSSFQTVSKDSKGRKVVPFSQLSNICGKKDFVRWKDSLRRDFTINGSSRLVLISIFPLKYSLYYDPFVNTIYDYVDGISDVMASQVRTVIPAHISFQEDCARILRGLRIVARLGLIFSKETAVAIQDHSWSITTLSKPRLMMEINSMLAYGAAVPSIYLLQKFKLLDAFLPIQAAYLDDQAKKESGGNSTMLMKLFSHHDKLFAADRPSNCSLWLGLLAFHMALINRPQNDIVVWTFSSVLFLGTWDRGINFVKGRVKGNVKFVPELLADSRTKADELENVESISDEIIAEKISQLASLVKSSIYAFNDHEALKESLNKYQKILPFSDVGHLMFVSEKAGKTIAELFDVLEHDIKSYIRERETYDINYDLLKRGDLDETRYVLGKIIFDTLHTEHANIQNAIMHAPNDDKNPNASMHAPNDYKNPNANMHDPSCYKKPNANIHTPSVSNIQNANKDAPNKNQNANILASNVKRNQNACMRTLDDNKDQNANMSASKDDKDQNANTFASQDGKNHNADMHTSCDNGNQSADSDTSNDNKNQNGNAVMPKQFTKSDDQKATTAKKKIVRLSSLFQ